MRHTLRTSLCLLFLSGVLFAVSQAEATTHDPEKGYSALSLRDGGDVLRPHRETSSDYHWFIGLDGGITYSMFSNGPVSFFTTNPHNPRFPLNAHADEGNGVGFYLGLTLDFPLSDMFGLVFKGNYHTRVGSFDESIDLGEIHPMTMTDLTTVLNNKVDWEFAYLGLDALLRVNFGESGFYGLVGPSFGSLSSNTASLDQEILQPDDIYYTEDVNGVDDIVNFFRTASSEEEVAGFMETRIDLKAGLGYMAELSDGLFLVPEILIALPMTDFIDTDYELSEESAGLFDWYRDSDGTPLVESNPDFNMTTIFFTVGLRWRID